MFRPPVPYRSEDERHLTGLIVSILLFVFFGRVAELMALHLGSSFRIALILMAIAGLAVVVNGGVPRIIRDPVAILYGLFTVWLFLSTPFSVWRGGSLNTITESWLPSLVVFLCVTGALTRLADCRRAVFGIAMGVLVITILAFTSRQTVEGSSRLFIGGVSLGNPNYVAIAFLYAIPLMFYMAYAFGVFDLRGGLLTIGAVASCWVVMLTGSRGGLLGAAGGLMVLLWYAPRTVRLGVSAGVAAALVIMVLLAPGSTMARYQTVFSDDSSPDDAELDSALLSKEARIAHLKDSLRITFEHPLFGVGVGQFSVAEAHEAEAEGRRGRWLETHNSYTEVSSEAGIPALLLYLAAVVYALIRLHRTLRNLQGIEAEKSNFMLGLCLMTSFATLLVTAFFASVAYMPYIPILVAISVAYCRLVQLEVQPAAAVPGLRTPLWPGLPKPSVPQRLQKRRPPYRDNNDVRNNRIRPTPTR